MRVELEYEVGCIDCFTKGQISVLLYIKIISNLDWKQNHEAEIKMSHLLNNKIMATPCETFNRSCPSSESVWVVTL